jgi:hypothetical protein
MPEADVRLVANPTPDRSRALPGRRIAAMAKGPNNSHHRRVHYVPAPSAHGEEAATQSAGPDLDLVPPGVMWPESASGFEPSYYSPAGQLQRDAQIASNISSDPAGVFRAIRGSWGLWIMGAGLLLIVAVALISAALS